MDDHQGNTGKNGYIVTRAHYIMKNDSRKLSMKSDSLFWNEPFSGLSDQEKQNFTRFYNIEDIPESHIDWNVKSSDIFQKILGDYYEMLYKYENNKTQKLLFATQMAFIYIIKEALRLLIVI